MTVFENVVAMLFTLLVLEPQGYFVNCSRCVHVFMGLELENLLLRVCRSFDLLKVLCHDMSNAMQCQECDCTYTRLNDAWVV